MKQIIKIIVLIAVSISVFGCNNKNREEQKALLESNKNLALKFLHGVQDGDKKAMYDAAGLTEQIVANSREKLIHSAKYKQTDAQKKDLEHALRVSGNIDFIAAKIKVLLPKTAAIQITNVVGKDPVEGGKTTEYTVQVTNNVKEDAIHDKTGKAVKVMVLPFLSVSRLIDGNWIHDFSFDTKDFEKLAVRNFDVLTYF